MAPALEEILIAFEQKKEIFSRPYLLSLENRDVIVKYLCSMLKVAEERSSGKKEASPQQLIHGFCQRYGAEESEMKQLLSDPERNWVDYRLYTAFSVFCQQQLGLGDEEFFQRAADQSFLDYQSRQIAAARFVPINMVLSGMSSQFKNWTKVTEVEVEKLHQGARSFRLKRKTLTEYKAKLAEALSPELLQEVLRRDCDFTNYAFATTFQKLFNQSGLLVRREKCEADGAEWSEYIVQPAHVYRTVFAEKLYDVLEWITKGLKERIAGKELHQLQEKNAAMEKELFGYRQSIVEKTEESSRALAESERNRLLAGKLAGELAEARSAGESHSLKNQLQSILNTQEQRCMEQITNMLSFGYEYCEDGTNHNHQSEYLQAVCQSFAIPFDSLSEPEQIVDALHRISVSPIVRVEASDALERDAAIDDLFGDVLSEEVQLDGAYSRFKELQAGYQQKFPEEQFYKMDPFTLLFSLRDIQEGVALAQDKMSKMGKMESVTDVLFASALEEALEQARLDKKVKIEQNGLKMEVSSDISYNPTFTTIKDLFVFMLRDLFYNGIDAGSVRYQISTLNAGAMDIKALPLAEKFTFKSHPLFYLRFENEISGFDENVYARLTDKAAQLNNALSGHGEDTDDKDANGKAPTSISTKVKGGQGTAYLRNFCSLHHGHAYYEPSLERKSMCLHIYFEKMGM